MTKEERRIRFGVAIEEAEKVYSDYCRDLELTREQVTEFLGVIQHMRRFHEVLIADAKKESEYVQEDMLSEKSFSYDR